VRFAQTNKRGDMRTTAEEALLKTVLKASLGMVVALALVSVGSTAHAREPSKPSEKKKPAASASDEPSTPGKKKKPAADEPGKPSKPSDEPGTKSGDEPGGKSVDEPGGKTSGEPGGGSEEPTPKKPPVVVKKKKKKPSDWKIGIGPHLRAIFIHPWFTSLFFKESTPLNSMAFGLEAVFRKGSSFDIIASIDFGLYGFEDGNYLERGKNPTDETDYVQFDGFNILYLGVHFIKHESITDWLSIVWGGGLGAGFTFGNIYRVSTGQGCNAATAGDEQTCMPLTSRGWDPNNPELWLNDPQNQGSKSDDSPSNPRRFKESRVWPVVPLIHLLVGLDFKITDQFGVRVDGGFRNAFYIGAASHYFF
jgi:hypothetical protein